MRLLVTVIWVVALYLVVRLLLRRLFGARREPPSIREALVKDPVCQTYLPRSRALSRTINGTTHYFCSEECAAKYRGQGPGVRDPQLDA